MQGRHFLTQSEVDVFVSENEKKRSNNSTKELCSDFQAGSSLRSKGKAKKLDEKGVLGSTCRHSFPLLFCSLMLGERFSYLAFLIRELLKLPHLQTGQVTVVYDVACQLEKHLQERYADLPSDRLTYALPVFHAYGHKMLCQLTKSLRVTSGAGLADGENLERLWSYLRAFGPMTKEMTASNRTDLLTYALLHYSRKERFRLGQSLRERLDRANKARDEATEEIATLGQGVLTGELVNKWANDDVQAILNAPEKTTSRSSLQEDYAFKLFKLNMNPDDIEAERNVLLAEQSHGFIRSQWGPDSAVFSRCLTQFAAKQREMLLVKMRQEAFDRKFLISSMRKYGIGQAVSNRIGKQIKKATKKLTSDMDTFNCMKNCPPTGRYPTEVTFAEVCDPQSPCFIDSGATEHYMSLTTKRKLVAAYKKRERAEEEGIQAEADVNSALFFFFTQHAAIIRLLNASLQSHGLPVSPNGVTDLCDVVPSFHPSGEVPFIFAKMFSLEREACKLIEAFGLDNTFPQVAIAYVGRVFLAESQEFCEQLGEHGGEDDNVADLLEELSDQPDAQSVLIDVYDPHCLSPEKQSAD